MALCGLARRQDERRCRRACSINVMDPLFEVYRGGKGRYREGSTKVYRPNEKRSSSMDMREEIYLLVAGAWRIHVALRDCYLWS
jgi:hypothetical protein